MSIAVLTAYREESVKDMMNVTIIDLRNGDIVINFGGEYAHTYSKTDKVQILEDLVTYADEQTCESWDNNEIEHWEDLYQNETTDELTIEQLKEELENY